MTGACGNRKRVDSDFGNPSCGTTADQPWPSSPKPCNQITDAVGLAPVSISIAGSSSVVVMT